MNNNLTSEQIEYMRININKNIDLLMYNRSAVDPQVYTNLINFQRFTLNILDNLQARKTLEKKNPKSFGINTIERKNDNVPWYENANKAYTNDSESWEHQFSKSVINSPTFCLPATNVWAVPTPDVLNYRK